MAQTILVMPKMSMTMTEGEVVEILVAVGDEVTAGQVIAVVGTDKTDMEVESDHAGTVSSVPAKPGDVLEVGAPLIVLETVGEDLLAGLFGDAPAPEATAEVVSEPVAPVATPVAEVEVESKDILAMPGARKLAKEQGIDLATVAAASPSGVIKQSDLAGSGPVAASSDKKQKARALTAKVVSTALDIPQFSLTKSVEISRALPDEPSLRAELLIDAWGKVLNELANLNEQFVDGGFQSVAEIRVAVLTATPLGFVSPVVSITGEWKQKLAGILSAAKENKIAVENLAGATTSVTDLSGFGITQANTLLFAGQSSGINIGSQKSDSNKVTIDVTIVLDHRIADPGDGAKALDLFGQRLNEVLVG